MSSSVRRSSTRTAGRLPVVTVPRPLLVAAAALGLAAAAVGVWLFGHPASMLGRDPEVFLVRVLVGPRTAAALLTALGLAGACGALLALLGAAGGRSGRRRPTAGLGVLALVEVAGFGVALQSVTTISLAGYLLAMVLPLGVLVLVVLVVRRYRRLRWPVLAALAIAVVATALSWSPVADALSRLGSALATGFAAAAPKLGLTLLTAAVVAVWVLVALRLARGSSSVRTVGQLVRRHRTALALVAAAGPLPYGLLRMTWLTPWPMGAPGAELPPEVRLWGVLLGCAALLGSVLTLGLVRPWGGTFPSWFPRLAGRPVPIAAAVVPGGLVAGLVCAAAVPMLRLALLPAGDEVSDGLSLLERIGFAFLFPFWLWGPALALAVWGYARHRAEGVRREDARG